MTNIMVSAALAMRKLNRGSVKKKFQESAVSVAAASVGPRPTNSPRTMTVSR